TPWSVFQDGPNGEPTGRRPERAGAEARQRARAAFHNRNDDVYTGLSTARAWATIVIHVGRCPESIGGPASQFHIRPGRIASPHPLPSRQFQALFDSLLKYLALDGIYRPIRAAFPNNPTRRQRLVVRQGPGTTGLSPSLTPPSRGLGLGPPLRTHPQTTIQTPGATDSHAGLFPVRLPLLGESSLVALGTVHVARGSPCLEPGEKRARLAMRVVLDHHLPRCRSPPRARLFEPTASQGLPGGQHLPPPRALGRAGRGVPF
ncbi:hypothetical protein S245_060326, partial [Arachis hypogaea]